MMVKMSLTHRMARAEARREGATRFIGDPCPHGHRERNVRDGRCCACEKAHKSARRWAVERGPNQWAKLVPVKHRAVQAIPVAAGGYIRPPTKAKLMSGK